MQTSKPETLKHSLGTEVENENERPPRFHSSHLGPGDEEKAACEQQTLKSGLEIAELHPFQVEHRLAVGQHQSVQSQDLKHLQRGHQSAAALLDHVTD